MYFQDILQGIDSNLMDSNLFQLKVVHFVKHTGGCWSLEDFFLTYFQASVGLVFWEYQTGSLIWVIGHLAYICHIDNMPRDYMSLNISLAEARAEAVWLRTQMHQKGCTCKSSTFQEISDRLCKLLAYIASKERQQKQLEKQARQPPP